MTPAELNARSVYYASLMEDGALKEAFDAIERDYTAECMNAHIQDERERLWLAVQVVRKVRSHFAQAINAGFVSDPDMQALRRVK